jgi:hypothetical protein
MVVAGNLNIFERSARKEYYAPKLGSSLMPGMDFSGPF